jgi:hypothetical protein
MKAKREYILGDHVLKRYPDLFDYENIDKLSAKIKTNSL